MLTGAAKVVKRTVDATTDEITSELQEALKADPVVEVPLPGETSTEKPWTMLWPAQRYRAVSLISIDCVQIPRLSSLHPEHTPPARRSWYARQRPRSRQNDGYSPLG